MRYYQLIIGTEVYRLDVDNPGGPRITFNINSFEGPNSNRPGVIRIYNVDSILKRMDHYKDKTLILRAGIKSCPYINRQGVGTSTSDYLFCGKILNSGTIWEEKDTVSVFGIQGTGQLENVETVAQINVSDPVATQLIKILSQYYGKWFKFIATIGALTVFSNAIQTVPIRPHIESSMCMRFFTLFMNQFGLSMRFDAPIQTYTIYKTDDISDGIGLPHIINPADIINQPKYESFAEVSISIQLNGSLRIGQNVWIAPNIPILGALGDFAATLRGGSQQQLKVATQGLFKIIQIEHVGDSRSNDSQAWCTNLLLVPSSDILDFQAILSKFNSSKIGGALSGIVSRFF